MSQALKQAARGRCNARDARIELVSMLALRCVDHMQLTCIVYRPKKYV